MWRLQRRLPETKREQGGGALRHIMPIRERPAQHAGANFDWTGERTCRKYGEERGEKSKKTRAEQQKMNDLSISTQSGKMAGTGSYELG